MTMHAVISTKIFTTQSKIAQSTLMDAWKLSKIITFLGQVKILNFRLWTHPVIIKHLFFSAEVIYTSIFRYPIDVYEQRPFLWSGFKKHPFYGEPYASYMLNIFCYYCLVLDFVIHLQLMLRSADLAQVLSFNLSVLFLFSKLIVISPKSYCLHCLVSV